jgi:hypothetical protein
MKLDPWTLLWVPSGQQTSAVDLALQMWKASKLYKSRSSEVRMLPMRRGRGKLVW